MRKLLLLILIALILPSYVIAGGVGGVANPAKVGGVAVPDKVGGVSGLAAAGGGGGCPAWGTYGNSDGNILFAWDGRHASGYLYGCFGDESVVGGTQTDGTISTEGSDVVYTTTAGNQRITFANSYITWDQAGGLTVWVSVRTNAVTYITALMELAYNTDNRWYCSLYSNGDMYSSWSGSATSKGATEPHSYVDDNSTWNDVACSVLPASVGSSAEDHGANVDTEGWTWDDDDPADWASEPTTLRIGELYAGWSATDIDIRRMAIIAGKGKSVPW